MGYNAGNLSRSDAMNVPSIMGQPMLGAVVAADTVAHAGPFNSIYVMV